MKISIHEELTLQMPSLIVEDERRIIK